MGYRVKYTQTKNNVSETNYLPTTGTVYEEETPNSAWNSDVVYAGTAVSDVSDMGSLSWGSDYSNGTFSGENLGATNFRFAIQWYSERQTNYRYGFKYTGLGATQVDYYNFSGGNTVNLSNPLTGDAKSVYTNGSSPSHPFLSFISQDLNPNDLIVVPYFSVSTFTLSNYRGGEQNQDYIDGVGKYYGKIADTRNAYTWSQIKPEDKTAAGENYDDDLFNYGYKKISEDNLSVTYQIVTGVRLVTYYGKSSNAYDDENDTYVVPEPAPENIYGDRSSISYVAGNPDSVIFNNITKNGSNFMILNEGYLNGKVYYYNTPGVLWSPLSSAIELASAWTIGSFNNDTLNSYVKNTYYNSVNSDYSNQRYGGIIVENSIDEARPTGHVLFPGMPLLMGNLPNNDNNDYGNTNTDNYRYLDNLANGNNPCFPGFRKGRNNNFKEYTAIGCFFSIKDLWKKIACYGIYVADSLTHALKAQLGQNIGNNNHIYLGYMDSSGVTNGTMLQGGDIADSVQAGIDDIIQNTPYTPVEPGPGPGGDDPSNPPTPGGKNEGKLTGAETTGHKTREFGSGSVTYYGMNISQVEDFKAALWSQPADFYDAIQIAGRQNTSIFDYIASFRYYPSNMNVMGIPIGAVQPVYLGTGAKFSKSDGTDFLLNPMTGFFGQINWCSWNLANFTGWRENFLDYAPYLKMSIYLPYAGTFDLDPQVVASINPIQQATIYARACVDLNTGSLTYFIDADGVLVLEKTIKFGVDLPLTGNDSVQQSTAIIRSTNSLVSTVLGGAAAVGTSIASGNVVNAAGAAVNTATSLVNSSVDAALANRQVPVQVGGFGGTMSNITQGQDPYITIYRQKIANPKNYGHTVGYLTQSTHKISELTGFTKCTNPDLSGISATDEEKAEIASILTDGFYA